MKKTFSALLAVMLLVVCLAGCQGQTAAINPDAVLGHLLQDITYDAPLVNSSDLASLYFADLPQGAKVDLYLSSSGYFPDEVARITLSSEGDQAAAKASVEAHLAQLRGQFQNYIPEEVATIDNAVIWQSGKYLFLVVTSDHKAVSALLEKAATLQPIAGTLMGTSPTMAPPPTTLPPETEPPATEPPAPVIPMVISKNGYYSQYKSGVYLVDNAAFEPHGYDPNTAKRYAALVSTVADALAGQVNVYCLPIPTAMGITMPDDIRVRIPNYCDQGAEIADILGMTSPNVIGVNCYNNMMVHREEYLYCRTDHHWNGLGAYYAYDSFCTVSGQTPYTPEQRGIIEFPGFLGTLFYSHSDRDWVNLGNTPDTIQAFPPVSQSATMFFITDQNKKVDYPIIQDVSDWGSDCKYLCFAGADQPYAEFHNPEVTDGSKLIVIKESYGNAMLPLLVDHYSVVYEIDYRYWKGNLVDFAREVGADDILFANNVGMISTGILVGSMSRIIPK